MHKEEFETNKRLIKIRKSEMDRQHNDKMKKDKRTDSDLQNTTQKTGDELRCLGGESSSGDKSGMRKLDTYFFSYYYSVALIDYLIVCWLITGLCVG